MYKYFEVTGLYTTQYYYRITGDQIDISAKNRWRPAGWLTMQQFDALLAGGQVKELDHDPVRYLCHDDSGPNAVSIQCSEGE